MLVSTSAAATFRRLASRPQIVAQATRRTAMSLAPKQAAATGTASSSHQSLALAAAGLAAVAGWAMLPQQEQVRATENGQLICRVQACSKSLIFNLCYLKSLNLLDFFFPQPQRQ